MEPSHRPRLDQLAELRQRPAAFEAVFLSLRTHGLLWGVAGGVLAVGKSMRSNRSFDTDTELASFSLTLEPNADSDQWGSE